MIGVLGAARRRVPHRGDDRGSMAMLLLVTLLGTLLGGLLVPIIVSQDHTTRFDTTRVHALDAAQAGIDVVVGKIRNATGSTTTSDGKPTGDASGLPCGPFSGNAVSNGVSSYYVEILYYTKDPVANPSATPMICAKNYGPYDAAVNSRTPRYACIIATGVDEGTVPAVTTATNTGCTTASGSYGTGANNASKGRTLVTTYVFTTDDTNFSGGVIRIFPDASGNQYCLDAGSATPVAGSSVTLQMCSTANPPAQRQTFAYRSDLSIQLVSSASATSSGLCLDAATPHATGNPMYLATCSALGSAQPRQQWSIDDNSHLQGAKSDGSNIDGFCINASGQAAGIVPTLQPCAGSVTDTHQTWVPSPSTGAGMAGATNKQLVNFYLFANCLDVTGQNPASTFLILYTCKQNPSPSNVAWNQKFTPNPALGTDKTTPPTPAELVTTSNGTRYCLTSPMSAGGYVTVQSGSAACPSTVPASGSGARWTIYRIKDASLNDLPYDSKYVIKDANGLCLGLGPNSDLLNGTYVKAVVTPCDGSTSQKWNADPSTGKSALQNTTEK
ncbi:MAG: hypothetical protein JWO57_1486 [Pseudonocardiales bacterium]|nr:hypothetical protein [Pseudonocardiales bacterium]